AAEQVRLSRADVLPRVSLGAGTFGVYDTRDLPQTLGSFSLSATVSQLVYDGGRWWNQIAQSDALADAQADQAAEQRLASELEGVRRANRGRCFARSPRVCAPPSAPWAWRPRHTGRPSICW
ncbi:MAG TPA: TolC family protein, partial [Myxococcaceae bacterium]|nr:TolC family protein [Myxococcaceae bacterium]